MAKRATGPRKGGPASAPAERAPTAGGTEAVGVAAPTDAESAPARTTASTAEAAAPVVDTTPSPEAEPGESVLAAEGAAGAGTVPEEPPPVEPPPPAFPPEPGTSPPPFPLAPGTWYEETEGTAAWDPRTQWDEETGEPPIPASEAGSSEGALEGSTGEPYDFSADEPYGFPEDTRWYGEDETQGGRAGRRLGRRTNGLWPELVIITAVAVIIAAVILAVTSANQSSSNPGSSGVPLTSTGPAGSVSSTPSTSSSTVPSTSTTTTAPAATTTPGGGALSLTVTPALENTLVKSWLDTNPGGVDLGPADVAGTARGEVYYGFQPATATYWAGAAFQPSPTLLSEASTAAGQAKLRQFEGWFYWFSWKQGRLWNLLGELPVGSCPNIYVPAPVLGAWKLCG
ncbi:MAG TPA: hypothetical protein VED59_03480 [Acidimicrobiales bacterium]|nr:hypothetical protein [Acidimicrobiales bacterium]